MRCTSTGFIFSSKAFLVNLGIALSCARSACNHQGNCFIYWKECHVLFSSIKSNVLVVVKVSNIPFLSALASFFLSSVSLVFFQFSLFRLTLETQNMPYERNQLLYTATCRLSYLGVFSKPLHESGCDPPSSAHRSDLGKWLRLR